MISAVEFKNRLERYDKKTSLFDFNIQLGFLPALIIFPLFLMLNNPVITSSIISSPFLFGFGFAVFFIMYLGISAMVLIGIKFMVDCYIDGKKAVRRFNIDGMLEDDFLIRKMARGLDMHLFTRLLMKFEYLFELIFEDMKEGLRHEFKEILKEKDQEIKQLHEIIDDTSFKADYKQKKLDPFQKILDEF
jgi:hypothetical protein